MSDQDYRDFPPGERPDVEVLVDGTWYAGELHAWAMRDGTWWAHVTYRTAPAQQYRATVPSARIREVLGGRRPPAGDEQDGDRQHHAEPDEHEGQGPPTV